MHVLVSINIYKEIKKESPGAEHLQLATVYFTCSEAMSSVFYM